MKLYDHQKKILKHNPRYHLLAWEVGTGKSLATIKLVEQQDIEVCLVVCPKSLVDNWYREIDKWQKDKTKQWLVVTKEQFRRDWEKLDINGQALVIDESHWFAGYTSQIH
jgi:SNF2 family DNA or RNA helicase